MSRKRNELGPAAEAKIKALMMRGASSQTITASLRACGLSNASPATIARRMAEMRAGVHADIAERKRLRATKRPPEGAPCPSEPPSAPSRPGGAQAPPLPESPDAIPEGTDLDTLDRWLKIAERNGRTAEDSGNLQALAQMGRLSASLLEAKRKGTPLPPEDPNDHPDMLAAKERARVALHKLVEQAVGP